jgi:hypothetical protein
MQLARDICKLTEISQLVAVVLGNEDAARLEIGYDLFRGQTGYLKDIDFVSNPDEESYLIKDEQGAVRRLVKVSFSGRVYSVSQGDVPLDAYGDRNGQLV